MAIATLILAGGNSHRMGQDKALLLWTFDGVKTEPMLTYLCRVALGVSDRVFVLSPRCDHYRALLPETKDSQSCRCLPESRSAGELPPGPLIAFAEGLAQIEADLVQTQARDTFAGNAEPQETDWVMLLACDLPGITVEELQRWRSQLETVPSEAIALLPRSPWGWEPLCGFYRRRSLDAAQHAVARGERSFQRWLRAETVATLTLGIDSDRPLQNCNTPEDWARFVAQSKD